MLDRDMQRQILRHLADRFPDFSRLKDVYDPDHSNEREIYNLHYLEGHGLVELKTKNNG